MTNQDKVGRRDEPGPQEDELALYARAYRGVLGAEELFARFQAHMHHARRIEAAPERYDGVHGLNGYQIAQGARMAARRMAILLAEIPTEDRDVLMLKVSVFEALIRVPHEVARSNAAIMAEAAMQADGDRAGVVLIPLDRPAGPAH